MNMGVCVSLWTYCEHRGGKETPCKELQEDDHHGMVNTGLTDSLRLTEKEEHKRERVS